MMFAVLLVAVGSTLGHPHSGPKHGRNGFYSDFSSNDHPFHPHHRKPEPWTSRHQPSLQMRVEQLERLQTVQSELQQRDIFRIEQQLRQQNQQEQCSTQTESLRRQVEQLEQKEAELKEYQEHREQSLRVREEQLRRREQELQRREQELQRRENEHRQGQHVPHHQHPVPHHGPVGHNPQDHSTEHQHSPRPAELHVSAVDTHSKLSEQPQYNFAQEHHAQMPGRQVPYGPVPPQEPAVDKHTNQQHGHAHLAVESKPEQPTPPGHKNHHQAQPQGHPGKKHGPPPHALEKKSGQTSHPHTFIGHPGQQHPQIQISPPKPPGHQVRNQQQHGQPQQHYAHTMQDNNQ